MLRACVLGGRVCIRMGMGLLIVALYSAADTLAKLPVGVY